MNPVFALLALLVMPGRPDVAKSVLTIHQDAFERRLKFEEVLLVRKISVDFVAGSGDNVQFKWTDDIEAIIHTHPDKGFEKPSSVDIETAKTRHVPVYVVSLSEIWYATPAGEVKQLEAK